jgi:transposase
MEAMRALKRRLSDVVFRQMMADARAARTGPGGHAGAATDSSAAGSYPDAGSSDKSLPGPATSDPTPASHPIPPVTPAASAPRRTAAAVKRAALDGGQDRRTLAGRE